MKNLKTNVEMVVLYNVKEVAAVLSDLLPVIYFRKQKEACYGERKIKNE
jgi:hypothetical protein